MGEGQGACVPGIEFGVRAGGDDASVMEEPMEGLYVRRIGLFVVMQVDSTGGWFGWKVWGLRGGRWDKRRKWEWHLLC